MLSGFLGGVVAWFPIGVGLAAHRYKVGGAVVRSNNSWVLLGVRSPATFSTFGRIFFAVVVLGWLCVFFGAMVLPGLVARVLGVPQTSSSIGYAIAGNFGIAGVAFALGPVIWRKLAL